MIKVNIKVLFIISGIMWTGVGLMLIFKALNWIIEFSSIEIVSILSMGIIAGIIIANFGFNKIALKNINRINSYENKVCFFAFQKWQSYILIIFMISLGLFIKSNSFIPMTIKSIIYLSIGIGLSVSSIKYYRIKNSLTKIKQNEN